MLTYDMNMSMERQLYLTFGIPMSKTKRLLGNNFNEHCT